MTDSGQTGPDPATPPRPLWDPVGGRAATDPLAGEAPTERSTGQVPTVPSPTAEPVLGGPGAAGRAGAARHAAAAGEPPALDVQPPAGERPTGAAGAEHPNPEHARASSRPRWLVPMVAAVVVLLAAVVVVAVLVNRGGAEPSVPPAASTVQLPSPTPTVEPVARDATTPFASALPTSVLQYALASSAANDSWLDAGAVEAYAETYTDGGSGSVEVLAGQFDTPEAAAQFGQGLVTAAGQDDSGDPLPSAAAGSDGTAPSLLDSGDVLVQGASAGSYVVVDRGDGTGVAAWWNGTVVFQVTGPADDIADLYAAYPL